MSRPVTIEDANRAFYAEHAPHDHFRTAMVHADLMAELFVDVLGRVAATIDPDSSIEVVELGAGDGALLTWLRRLTAVHEFAPRVHWIGIDHRPRPRDLDASIDWRTGDARDSTPLQIVGLVIAHEFFDDLDPIGLDGSDPRAATWTALVARIAHGAAIAVDYATTSAPSAGHMTAWQDGSCVPVVLDGTVNVTAPVDLEACGRAAARATGHDWTLARQRDVVRNLMPTDTSVRALNARAGLLALGRASRTAELAHPDGFGDYGWLVQGIGIPPAALIAAHEVTR